MCTLNRSILKRGILNRSSLIRGPLNRGKLKRGTLNRCATVILIFKLELKIENKTLCSSLFYFENSNWMILAVQAEFDWIS